MECQEEIKVLLKALNDKMDKLLEPTGKQTDDSKLYAALRAYSGDNTYLISFQEALAKYGSLTAKQLACVRKDAAIQRLAKTVKVEETPF